MTGDTDEMQMTGVRCSRCGAKRSRLWRTAGPPTPCLRCGDTCLAITMSGKAILRLSTEAALAVEIDLPEGWSARWEAIQRELTAVRAQRSDGVRPEAIEEATSQLLAFYVLCYHLKDALKEQAAARAPGRC